METESTSVVARNGGGAEGNGGAGGNGEHLLNASGFLLGVRKRFGSRQERVP